METERPDPDAVERRPVVIFLHHLKTGGTSLRYIIGRQYRPGAVVDVSGSWSLRPGPVTRLLQMDPRTVRLVYGRVAFGLHERLRRPARYFTLLRHPLERIPSLYHYAWEVPTRRIHERTKAHLGSLEEFVERGRLLEADNGQTRRVSGQNPPFGECTREMLDLAKRNLRRHFAAVGVTDRFDESLVLFKRTFGWGNVLYHEHHKSTGRPGREALSPRAARAIERSNAADIELYEFGAKLFDQAFARLGEDASREAAVVRTLKRAFVRSAASDAPPRWTLEDIEAESGVPLVFIAAYIELLDRDQRLQRENARLRRLMAKVQDQLSLPADRSGVLE